MNLLVLVASIGKNKELGDMLADIAKDQAVDVEVCNLAELFLPLYCSEGEKKDGMPEKATTLWNSVKKAQALLIVAPEYNGSSPPALCNAIAWISRAADDWRTAFAGKTVALATHSGGGRKSFVGISSAAVFVPQCQCSR